MMECCNTNPSYCPVLKAANPGVYLGDSSSAYPDEEYPNFCYLHGIACSRRAPVTHLSDLHACHFHGSC